MKIRITARNVMTMMGTFDQGRILETPQFSESFLIHLSGPAGAAEIIETKMLEPVVENKSTVKKKIPVKKKSKSKKPSS